MKFINIFYIAVIIVAAGLYTIQKIHLENIISFYGYAENKETEINFNYPIQVKKIYVSPGQSVKKDAKLIDVIRIDSKESLPDQAFHIDVINAEKEIWITKVEGQIELIKDQMESELSTINKQKEKLITENQFGINLYKDLESIKRSDQSSIKITQQIEALDEEYRTVSNVYKQKIENKKEELRLGSQPYDSKINRLNYEKQYKEDQSLIEVSLVAPKDGLVGNVYCKEEEHFTSYKTMLSLYEPNPSIIKGFVQEDFIMKISLNDSMQVRSTKDETLSYRGSVIGLGSRIVEIPSRLRKRPDIKTYGREIIVSIPRENRFLQKEKTVLELMYSPDIEKETSTSFFSLLK